MFHPWFPLGDSINGHFIHLNWRYIWFITFIWYIWYIWPFHTNIQGLFFGASGEMPPNSDAYKKMVLIFIVLPWRTSILIIDPENPTACSTSFRHLRYLNPVQLITVRTSPTRSPWLAVLLCLGVLRSMCGFWYLLVTQGEKGIYNYIWPAVKIVK